MFAFHCFLVAPFGDVIFSTLCVLGLHLRFFAFNSIIRSKELIKKKRYKEVLYIECFSPFDLWRSVGVCFLY